MNAEEKSKDSIMVEIEDHQIGRHFQAIIEKAPDGVALIDEKGYFKYISPSARTMFGYDMTEDVVENPATMTHPDDLQRVLSELNKIFEDPSYVPTVEYRFRTKQGEWRWVETTFSNLLANVNVGSIILNFRDITERKQLEEVQNFLINCGYTGTGSNFFESLSLYLSNILEAEYVWVDKLDADGLTANTLCVYSHGAFVPNITYNLNHTPCGEALGKAICVFPENVIQHFPLDDMLKHMNAQSYVGATLWSFDGKPIGIIAIIGQKPLKNIVFVESVLKVVAIRAAGELERIQMEEALRENELKYRTLFETADDAIMLLHHGKLYDCNAGAFRMFGCTKEQFIGTNPVQFSPKFQPDGQESEKVAAQRLQLALESGPQVFEWEHCRADGTPFSAEVSLNRLDFKGESYIQAIVRDVTERKKAERALKESEIKYRQIFDNTFDIMAFYEVTEDNRYKVITYNAAEAKLMGPLEYYENRYIDECIPPDLYEQFSKHYERCISEEKLITYEETINFQQIHKTFLTQLIPLKNSAGRVHQIIVISRDTTENKLLQNQLINQNEKLKLLNLDLIASKEKAEESDRLKSAFLANMSHEIRTPMNGILGFAEILRDRDLTGEQQQEYLQIIQKSGVRMLNIINDIIDISKIESGVMNLNLMESNLNEQMNYIYTFFKPEADAKKLSITLKSSLPDKEATIRTDREKLYAVMTNLVKNAIKYTSEGYVEFGYYPKSDHYLEFYVKDTGIGIPKERQSAIFERFIQADLTNRNALQGAGLGLAISKSFVEMMGGSIRVESEVGVGSTFYFTLPFKLDVEDESGEKNLHASLSKELQSRKLNILVADDDETSELLITITVKEFSNEILSARTGREAVERCRSNPDLDLILMDIQMPEMNGYEATRQIRKFNKNIIIIAQTAYGLSSDREKALEAGCNDYIAKPINKKTLLNLIQKYTGK